MDKTMSKQVARMSGFIRAIADQTHPLQTRLSLILTDFEPNKNRQGVPLAEAENILRTALHTPLKINFTGAEYYGHTGATPIGPITHVYKGEDNGRPVIYAEAVIWNDIYEDVADHLKVAFAEGVGTSWEIYFRDSEVIDGVEWLQGCVFAGTCVVETPAYGPNRTRVLAIAEKLNERAEALNMRLDMANEQETEDNVLTDNNEAANTESDVEAPATAASDTEELRNDISDVMSVLSNIYNGLYQMLDETFEIEQQLATNDMSAMAEQFTKLVASISKRFDNLKDKASTAEVALSELRSEIERKNAEAALTEKTENRKSALAEVGIEWSDERSKFYLDMADDIFEQYVSDLKTVKGTSAKAERKPKVPDAVASNITIDIKDLAAIIRNKH